MSSNIESISVYKSLEVIECSSIIKHFISGCVFVKAALDLSFTPCSFIPSLTPIMNDSSRMNDSSTYIYC